MEQAASDLLMLFSRYYFTLLMLVILVGLAQRALRDLRRGDQVPVVAGQLLVLSPGEGKTALKPGQRFTLGADCTLGRDGRCDIRLNDDSVRSRHAQVYLQAQRLMLADVGGEWGTFLNGRQVEESRLELYHGDVLQLGRVLMRVLRTDRLTRPQPDEDEPEELEEPEDPQELEEPQNPGGLVGAHSSMAQDEPDADDDEDDDAASSFEDDADMAQDDPYQSDDGRQAGSLGAGHPLDDGGDADDQDGPDDPADDEAGLPDDDEQQRLLQELELMRRRQQELEQLLRRRKGQEPSKGDRV